MEQKLLAYLRVALKYHATDIHFNLDENDAVQVEMRINGNIITLQNNEESIAFFRYLLFRANLDISNSTAPQTGRFEVLIDNQKVALRFAYVSSFQRKSGVLRILNNHPNLTIESLTYNPQIISYFKQIPFTKYGLYLFSGPTGSGKTTTLYTILDSATQKKIYTLEDPIEIYSNHYVQLQVNEKQHFTYEEGIKQLMRHDPDIIMIGEIRDEKAANIAVRSALTGHTVVSTIHSNSCQSTIERMLDLGVSKYQLSDVLQGITCQRLYSSNNQKIGIYEMMSRKEIEYYFEYHKQSENFIPLSKEVSRAIQNKLLPNDAQTQALLR